MGGLMSISRLGEKHVLLIVVVFVVFWLVPIIRGKARGLAGSVLAVIAAWSEGFPEGSENDSDAKKEGEAADEKDALDQLQEKSIGEVV
jgi:hypothetical protein